jgi:hypothetical protein
LAFKKRNPDLALRTPGATSLMRATGFNKPQVDRFYDLLLKLQEQFGFQAAQIYNADETGVSTVHKNDKVFSVKGKNTLETSHQQKEVVTSLWCFLRMPLVILYHQCSFSQGKKWIRMVV